jgi:SAM-dependent methyltransferase/uncharacterized membrane protein YphA (DoxX/SURF4 family)
VNTILIAARVVLAGVFLVAGVTKLIDLNGSRSALEGFGLARRWVPLGAVALPIAEILAAALLIPAATARAGAGLAAILLFVFMAGIVAALRRGTAPECHCFGQLHSRPVGRETLARNAVLAAIALLVLFAGSGPGLSSWWRSSSGSVIALAAMSVLVAVLAYAYASLWQDNRRLTGRTGQPGAQAPLRIGQLPPKFEARDLAGAVVRSDDLFVDSQTTVLVFTSATCGPCVSLLPELARWREMLAGRLGIHVLAAGDEAKNRELSSEHTMPILLDPDSTVAGAFGISATPSAIEIDPGGRVGGSPAVGTPEIEGLIRAALKPTKLSIYDQRRFLRAMDNGGRDLGLSVHDQERLAHAISKPVSDVDRLSPSRWERSRFYWALHERLTNLLFERGMSTAGTATELEHFEPDLVHYEPSSWLPLRWALRRLRPGPTDVFVDFGCGKGRVLCEAARRPFARVVGVDISQPLVEAAQANVERSRRRFKCQNVELLTADATEWDIPDDMTVGYLYHPFAGAAFNRVIDNVVQSIVRNPRRVRLVYVGPVLEENILDTGYFRLVRKRRGRGRRAKIFNSVSLLEHDPGSAPPRVGSEVSAALR